MMRSKISFRILFHALFLFLGNCQEERKGINLRLDDVAQNKFVRTTAPYSTCGYRTPTKYCAAVSSGDGMVGGACREVVCDQKCYWRDKEADQKPRFIDMLDVDQGPCVMSAEGRNRGSRSYRFINELGGCGLSPSSVPRLGPTNRDFTLSVWLRQDPSNAGVILEKIAGPGSRKFVVFTLLVGSRSLIFQYLGIDGRNHYEVLPVIIPSNTWYHLALQVFGQDITVYLDRFNSNSTGVPLLTERLELPIYDVNDGAVVRIGHRVRDVELNNTADINDIIEGEYPGFGNGTAQFVGRLQDFRWYDQALTNREINEFVTGKFRKVTIQSNCLCPPDYPRVYPNDTTLCVRNGVPIANAETKRRLNPQAHPEAYMLDGEDGTVWISRPEIYMPGGLSLVVDLLNGEYEVSEVVIKFYNSQPKTIAISRNSSVTDGEMKPWGTFADDCYQRFKMEDNGLLNQPDTANCQRFPSNPPYSNGTVRFVLMPPDRPGQGNVHQAPKLMDFIKAKQIQIRFTFHYYTATEGYDQKHIYYGVRSIQVIGKCNCHGHAYSCDKEPNPYRCACIDESFTEGNMCERCKPLYNDKEFRIGTLVSPNNCKKCECNNHAQSCHYERQRDSVPDDILRGGGGVCDNCEDNTVGLNCEECLPRFYRTPETPLDDKRACSPCRCRRAGVVNQTMECEQIGGQCPCKARVTSRRCDVCVEGYFNLNLDDPQGCQDCRCYLDGTMNRSIACEQSGGQCSCKLNVRGRTCLECEYGFKNLTDGNPDGCDACACNELGAVDQFCDPFSGQCRCRDHVQGIFCNECTDGFWGLSDTGCEPCGCDSAGTEPGTICNKTTGQCVCKANTQGLTCNECKDRFYNLNAANAQGCESCSCDLRGTVGGSPVCHKSSGECECKGNVGGRVCNLCRGNTFGLRASLDLGCEPCNCDPMGTALGQELDPHELVCDSNSGQCACLPSREGRSCDQCSPGFYLPPSNETGCMVCDCHPVGSTSQVCNNVTGMCPCKAEETRAGLAGRRCDQCASRFWNFHDLFGTCRSCDCDVAGSESDECNVITGQCECKGNVLGVQCDRCRPGSSQLSVDNPMGCYSHPEQQAAPVESSVGSRHITLSWNPPDHPNGDFLTYRLYRNNEEIHNLTDFRPFEDYSFNDTTLLPYTNYDYFVETMNIGGSVRSPVVRIRTMAGIPTGIPPLVVSHVRAHQASFEWGEPEVAHGPIETYVLQSVNTDVDDTFLVHYRGLSTRALIHSLSAFTNYTFTLRACTSGGCGDSLPVVVLTPEAKPAKQMLPRVVSFSNSSLHISWDPPQEPNGIIREYELMMRGKPGPDGVHRPLQRSIFQTYGAYNPRPNVAPIMNFLDPPETDYTLDGLQPYTEYEFLVSSSNRLGSVESGWSTGRTLEGTPVFMNPPELDPISSFEVNITWEKPDPVTEARGKVIMYQVILTRNNTSGNPFAPPMEEVVIYSTGPQNQHFLATGFEPYSSNKIAINLCNSVSCIKSVDNNVTTLPAAPEDQSPPTAQRRGSTLLLNWEDPGRVNGPQPDFMLMRSRVAFSEPPIEMSRGVRFPGLAFVHFPPTVLPRDASYTGIELRFRTFNPDCLLFFSGAPLSSQGVREEYVVLQLRDGRPWFLFDAQNNPTAVTIRDDNGRRYNDGNWHRIEANRFNRNGYLELDGLFTGSNTSSGSTTVIGVNDGVYVGGIPLDYTLGRPDDRNELMVVRASLIGCIKDIRVQRNTALGDWSNVTWDEADQWQRAYPFWQGCPITLDRPAVHFLGKGYLSIPETSMNRRTWSVTLSFRTEYSSGVLFYAGNGEDEFIMATILNGRIRLVVSSFQRFFTEVPTSSNTSSVDYQFCDGNWHDVALRSNNNQFSVEVNKVIRGSITSFPVRASTFSQFHVGGLPSDVISSMVTVLDDDARPFGGCMRSLTIDGKSIDLSRDVTMAYNVDLDGCPHGASNSQTFSEGFESSVEGSSSNSQPEESSPRPNITCLENNIDTVFNGMEHSFLDSAIDGLFTRYLYKVTSSNAGGEAQSQWMVARSGEGIPRVVPAPFNEQSVSGRQVSLEWKRPESAQGVISNYTLTAERQLFGDGSTPDPTPQSSNQTITQTFLGDVFTGTIEHLSPWTSYLIGLTACTHAGCAVSAAKTEVMTLEEIPGEVKEPQADVNASVMLINWPLPGAPNGRIIRYTLFHNSSSVYHGVEPYHLIPGLPIFTRQKFRLEACTAIGCNSSEEVTLFSGQLPPSHVDQPMVSVLGPHKVEVRWLEPAIMNGVFTHYVVHLRDSTEDLPERVALNSTERDLSHTIDDLIAGTMYYITITACTQGGCKVSSPTPCQTHESVPENIPAPDVESPSPHSFVAKWFAPELPNGIVTLYNLYQNEILVANSSEPSSTVIGELRPWSKHEFRVEVCTREGCAFSPGVIRRTQQSPPEGNVLLSVTVLGPRTLESRWGEPQRKNGEMMYSVICSGLFYVSPDEGNYQTRRESREMLNTTSTLKWIRVEELIPYSEYIVKVNASNQAGYVISNMRTVSMPPGSPDGVTMPLLTSHSPHSILASWKDPARDNARGNSLFQLQYRAVFPSEIERNAFDSATRQMSFNLTGLQPYKAYEFQLIASNEYGATHSGWASAYTMQARPSSMDPPIIYERNAWSQLVTWEPPSAPNGVIVNYRLFQNNELIQSLPGNVTEYEAEFLIPFTSYEYKIEACTLAGCTASNESRRIRTSASAPEGLEPPQLRSDTPASVFVLWKPPRLSNGILDNYRLERRHNPTEGAIASKPKLLGVFVPSQSLRYLDDDAMLEPFTSYQYRVICSTLGGGITTSAWETATTRPGRPGGVLAPVVIVTGSETVYVRWEEPLHPNGPLMRFELVFPDPRIEVSNVTLRSMNVTNLVPFTDYEIRFIACTTGGCTSSPSTHALTFADVPRDLSPPIATPISERTINIQWSAPVFPNGPDLHYELSRTILSQPLISPPSPYINVSQTVYTGTDLVFQDRTLEKFTTCEYRVSVFNSEGSLSSNGTIVTSLAGYPSIRGELNVAVHNHTSVYVWWERPSVEDLQGEVHGYMVRYNSTLSHVDEVRYDASATSGRISDLRPGTNYQFELNIDNGAHVVTSHPVFATTDDGAPHGLSPPVVYPLSPSQLRVSWLPPSQPNGRIVAYNVILDDITIRTNLSDASAYVIENLRPYTVYAIKMEACTVYACAASDTAHATTQETNPAGIQPPQTKVVGDNNIEITWTEPVLANGIIRRYHVMRRKIIACEEFNETNNEEIERYPTLPSGGCEYVRCKVGENVCGGVCYQATLQVCCDGVLHQVEETKECCGSNYIAARGRRSDVCCGGRFHSYIENHQCCHGKYLKVGAREICCRDPLEDRVVVGIGDACCGGVPYFNSGFQVCCAGVLKDGFNRKCCGGKLITNEQVCCGNPVVGSVYDVMSEKSCCGYEYLVANDTMCCHGKGEYKAYHHVNMTSSNMKCCMTSLINEDELCCNGEGYDPFREVCADEPTRETEDSSLPKYCGGGTVCPIDRSLFAGCDRCDMDRENFDCLRSPLIPHTSQNINDECSTPFIEIYSGPPEVLSYYDADLEYFKTYQFKIVVENKAGVGESEVAELSTAQAVPDDVFVPNWVSEDRKTITLSWQPPGLANGEIERYALMRDGLEIWSGMAFRHTDTREIEPYREYEYLLKVCTKAGCSQSSPVRATSVQGVPDSILPPRLTVTGAKSIQIRWIAPRISNGVIDRYLINETSSGTIHTLTSPMSSSNDFQFLHNQLKPYTLYYYTITACTAVGCTGSTEVSARTNQASPEGVWHRSALLPLNSTSLELIWTKPRSANGIIGEYRMLRRLIGDRTNGILDEDEIINLPQILVYEGGPEQFSFVDVFIRPGAAVQYQLIAINGAGYGLSETRTVLLPLEAPLNFPQVNAQALSPTSVRVDWTFGEEEDLQSVEKFVYEVIIQEDLGGPEAVGTTTVATPGRRRRSVDEAEDEVDDNGLVKFVSAGSNQSLAIDDLQPFTRYRIRVQTCDSNSTEICNIGAGGQVQTYSAPPEGMSNPIVKAMGPTLVLITWLPPRSSNGIIIGYRVYRREPRGGSPAFEERIFFSTDSFARSYSDSALRPFTDYEYQVRAANSEGEVLSEWIGVTTLEDTPSGVEAPILEARSAFAVQANWKEPTSPNGIITSYRLEFQIVDSNASVINPIVTAISTPPDVFEATFSGLRPYISYRVRVVAINQATVPGTSEWGQVMTHAAPPSEVSNLTAQAMADGESLLLSWEEPSLPNGKVEVYHLYEVGYETPLYTGTDRHHTMRRLAPYTEYHIVLEVCTGPELCTRSRVNTFRTAETAPEAQSPPQIITTNATSIMMSWTKPRRANGHVIKYQIDRRLVPRNVQIHGDDFANDVEVVYDVINPEEDFYNYTDGNLRPYTRYGYRVETSTRAGRVESDWIFTETQQGPPEGMAPPTVNHPPDNNPTSLIVTWQAPLRINGELQTFRLERNESTPLSFPSSQFSFVDRGLQPYTIYAYRIAVCTAGGCVISDVTNKRTYEEAPLYVAPPSVDALNSSAIKVSWRVPEIANGVVRGYQVRVAGNVRYEGLGTRVVIGGLDPYKSYEVSVEACTISGCRQSDVTEVMTLEAPPSGMEPPDLHATSSRSIEVIWRPPLRPNGAILRYEVLRDDEIIAVSGGGARRHHEFGLSPGTEYQYVVVAYNSVGSVRSNPPVSMTTNPSAPAGLAPPSLTPTSASSILSEWSAPEKPNGKIVNYTLSVRQERTGKIEEYNFPGSVFSYHVRGLEFFEEYSFWMRTCTLLGCVMSERRTQRTMEATPANQMAPRVSSTSPSEMSLSVSWAPPKDPNGLIRFYMLRRRRIFPTPQSSETLVSVMIANTTGTSIIDSDIHPFTQYQYQVVAHNEAGEAPSSWSTPFRSSEATPEGVPAPSFHDVTSRSVYVANGNPVRSNGIVRFYHVFMKKDNSSEPLEKMSSSVAKDQTITNLKPSTRYVVVVEMCTLEYLCTRGPPTYVTTLSAPPSGQGPPQLLLMDSINASLSWNPPQQQNGEIRRYELRVRKTCPLVNQPFEEDCQAGPAFVAYSGPSLSAPVTGLSAYTRYAFQVTSYNDDGKSESEWESAVTSKSHPTYNTAFSAQHNISVVELRWGNTFSLNGMLVRYEVEDRGENIYVGTNMYFYVKRTSAQVHEFKVKIYTDVGTAESPVFVYDTTKNGQQGVLMAKDNTAPPDGPIITPSAPFYQSMWFILVLAFGAMVVLVVALAFLLHRIGRRSDGKTSRMDSLKSQNRRSTDRAIMGMYEVGPYSSDGSLQDFNHSAVQTHDIIDDGGYLNQTFSNQSLDRSTNHLINFNQSAMSDRGHVIYDDQWDGDGVDPMKQINNNFSSGYGMEQTDSRFIRNFDNTDDDSLSKQPMEFVDTHI